jgi:hypothetical protein
MVLAHTGAGYDISSASCLQHVEARANQIIESVRLQLALLMFRFPTVHACFLHIGVQLMAVTIHKDAKESPKQAKWSTKHKQA